MADDDGNIVENAGEEKCDERKPKIGGKAEDDGGDTEADDGEQHVSSGVFHGRRMGENKGHEDCTDGGGGSEHAEAQGADVENIFREGGEEGSGSAEEDGEHVEGNCAEDDFVFVDKANSREERLD